VHKHLLRHARDHEAVEHDGLPDVACLELRAATRPRDPKALAVERLVLRAGGVVVVALVQREALVLLLDHIQLKFHLLRGISIARHSTQYECHVVVKLHFRARTDHMHIQTNGAVT